MRHAFYATVYSLTMASELRLTTADRTLSASVDPSEPTYAAHIALLDPKLSEIIRAAKTCKLVFNLTGGDQLEVSVTYTARARVIVASLARTA